MHPPVNVFQRISHTALLLRVFGHTPDRDCYCNLPEYDESRTLLKPFGLFQKYRNIPIPESRFQALHGLTRFLEGRRAVVVAVCFVGRVMPVGGLHTQAVKVTEVTTRTSLLLCYGSLPFSLSGLLVRSPPSYSCRFNPAACLCARIRPPTRLPHYSTTPPLRFEPVGTQCTVPRAPLLAIITAYLLWLHTHTQRRV